MEQQYTNTQSSANTEITQGQQSQNQETEQVEPRYMWGNYYDSDGNLQSGMLPNYYYIFQQYLTLIGVLRQTVNKKWKPEQVTAYQKYLTDLENYINYYIMTGTVYDFNVFEDAMVAYGQTTNPLGKELFDTQIDYMGKKESGYDFKLDKKNKKANKPAQEKQQVKKPIVVEKKEQVIIRKGDPEINIQTLMTTNWPQDKYINIDIFKKENINLVFIGHVDSGKSTLTGNIMKELGQVDEQQIARSKQEAKENHMQSWELAGIADVDPNERKRGKTVEYAKMNFTSEHRRFTVFDAPGHKNYVPNMIMGACQADIAVLIISSKEGQFESGFDKEGQTKEHAMLAKALGVSGFMVAVTKLSTNDWSQKRFNDIKEQVAPFLENSCGFSNVTFIPIDSINNVNIHKPIENSWYKGPCLIDYLNTLPLPERKPLAPLRIPIIDKFKQVGNLYLYGKVESGTIIEDQTITILPSRTQAVIKQIYNAKDERLPFAMAGENVKLRMKGIEQNDTKRGDMICNNLNYCQETYEFKATINVLEIPEAKKLISSGYECVLHMHAIAEQIEIFKVEAKFDPQTKKSVAANFLKSGEQGTVTIKCNNILCLEKYEFMHSLGRFTLRDEGKTVGYGLVTKIKPAKKLLDEQKEQLGMKKEENGLEKQLQNLNVNN